MNFRLFFTELPEVATYALSALLLVYGVAVSAMTLALLVRATRRKEACFVDTAPEASVVIPFRNEERNLNALLTSIDNQNYSGTIEVVLVNDGSTDGGADAIKKFMPRNKNICINAVDLRPSTDTDAGTSVNTNIDTDARLTSKQRALDMGVDKSSHRLILFTDADMVLEPTWVGSMVNSHLSTRADMVFGHTAIARADVDANAGANVNTIDTATDINVDNGVNTNAGTNIVANINTIGVGINTVFRGIAGFINGLFALLESYQLEYLFSFAYAFSKLNLMGSCMGNNVLVTKEVYAACGGQRGVGYSIVEDRALLGLVRKKGFKTAAQEPFTVTACTYPSQSKRRFADQILRWATGGLRPGGGLFVAGLLLLTQNILFLLSIMGVLPLIPALQSAANFILTWAFLSISFNKNGTPVSKILYPAYYIFMMMETALFLPLMLLGRGIKWKDRKI